MKTLDDFDVSNKTVFIRVDLNSPVDEATKKVEPGDRFPGAAESIRELSKKKAKVVVLAHQGRKGDADFTHLDQHALLLGHFVKKPVQYVPDVCGDAAKGAVAALKPGAILLLDNVRLLDDEAKFKTIRENANATLVRELAPLCDVFVLDGFSVAHRPQASVVGFIAAGKPSCAGRVLQREVESIRKVQDPAHPVAFVLGGAKPEDSVQMMEHWLALGKMDYAVCGGVLASLFLHAKGARIGKPTIDFLQKQGALEFVPKAKELMDKYEGKILLPKDVAIEENGARVDYSLRQLPLDGAKGPVMDVGRKTANYYARTLKDCRTIVVNGPLGVYEKDAFQFGTKKVFTAIKKASAGKKSPDGTISPGAFSLWGGGHTLSALAKFKISHKKLGYVSLAGKALIAFLSGEKLAGIEALEGSLDG